MCAGTKTDGRRITAQSEIWIHIALISASGTIAFTVAADDVTSVGGGVQLQLWSDEDNGKSQSTGDVR